MKNKRELIFSFVFFAFLFFILLNFGIHIFRTARFNETQRIISPVQAPDDKCSFEIKFRGGAADSWLKRDVSVAGKVCTLRGITFDGVLKNDSEFEISDWQLRVNINQKCYVNNSWCGLVEIHQKNKVQTLDLRNIKAEEVYLDGEYVAEDFLIILDKGDFIIYCPSEESGEFPVHPFNGNPGSITVGFIFYTDASQDLNINDFSVIYHFRKGYFQGKEPLIFTVLIILWFIVLIVQISVRIAYKKAEKKAERMMELQRIQDIESYNKKLNEEVENKTAHIKEIQQKVVLGLANVIGNRDFDTGGHVKRTSDIIKIIVDEFRNQNEGLIDDEKAKDIIRAAPMHDLGKIYIETSILCKPGKLTDEEYAKMKKHAENSGEIVKLILRDVEELHFVKTAINIARFHHERWDGRGYPEGLSGEEIPLEARLMAIADVYDALVSRRCYKQSMSFEKAFEIMSEGMGSQFDPQMKNIVIACRQKLEDYYTINR